MKQLGEAAIELARSCRSESVQCIQGTNRAVYHEVYQQTCCPRHVIDFSLKFSARGTVSELLRQKQRKTWGRGRRQMEAGGGWSIREQLVGSWYLILILLSLTASLMVWEWAGECAAGWSVPRHEARSGSNGLFRFQISFKWNDSPLAGEHFLMTCLHFSM